MSKYIALRLLQSIPMLIAVVTLTFVLIHTAPGDPVTYMYAAFNVSQEELQALRESLGLNDPLYVQFGRYVARLFRGDLGFSYINRGPVIGLILERLPATLLLSGTGILLAAILGTLLGALAAVKARSLLDYFVSTISIVGYCMPVFWLGIVLILTLSLRLRWFPSMGIETLRTQLSGLAAIRDVAWHLVLPAITLGSYFLAEYARLTRASMLEVLGQDFIVTARAKGLRNSAIYLRHALRNSLLPVIAVLGVHVGMLLVSATVTETVFAWPGIGRLTYNAILQRDYPLLMGVFVFVAWFVILANLVSDIACAALDPRIRYYES